MSMSGPFSEKLGEPMACLTEEVLLPFSSSPPVNFFPPSGSRRLHVSFISWRETLVQQKKSKKNMFFGGGETAMCKYVQRKDLMCGVQVKLHWAAGPGASTWISIVPSHEGLTTWLCFSQIKSGCHFVFKVVIQRCTNKSWVTDWNIWNGR